MYENPLSEWLRRLLGEVGRSEWKSRPGPGKDHDLTVEVLGGLIVYVLTGSRTLAIIGLIVAATLYVRQRKR